MLVKLMVRVHLLLDSEVFEQKRGCARIFGKDKVNLAQDIHRSQSNISEIAYRCGDYVEFRHISYIYVQ